MLLLSPRVHAQSAVQVGIPVLITTNGSPTTGQISITSEDSLAPMPSENPVTINGNDNVVLSYTKTGTWKYTIKQVSGSDLQTTYDTTLYHLTIFIGYKEGGLYSVVTLYKAGSSDKDGEALFKISKKTEDNTPKTKNENPSKTTGKNTSKKSKTSRTSKKASSSSSENGGAGSNDHNSGNTSDSSTNGSEGDGKNINHANSGSHGDQTTKGSGKEGTKGVKTSDPTIIIPYVIAAGLSFTVLVFLLVRTLKRKH
jgi:pilin isopeptide linkage protein